MCVCVCACLVLECVHFSAHALSRLFSLSVTQSSASHPTAGTSFGNQCIVSTSPCLACMQHCSLLSWKRSCENVSLLSFRYVPSVCERERERKKERERDRVGRAKGIARREEGKQGVCVCVYLSVCVSACACLVLECVHFSTQTLSRLFSFSATQSSASRPTAVTSFGNQCVVRVF